MMSEIPCSEEPESWYLTLAALMRMLHRSFARSLGHFCDSHCEKTVRRELEKH